MAGKGSAPRKFSVPREVYESNHARIFGQKPAKAQYVPPFAAPAQLDANSPAIDAELTSRAQRTNKE